MQKREISNHLPSQCNRGVDNIPQVKGKAMVLVKFKEIPNLSQSFMATKRQSAFVFNIVSNPEQQEASGFMLSLPLLRKVTQSTILSYINSEQLWTCEIDCEKSFSDLVTINDVCRIQIKIIILFIFVCWLVMVENT